MVALAAQTGWIQKFRAVELSLVCPNCSLVHKVRGEAFEAPAVTCPTCSFPRASSELVSLMPRSLVRQVR